ncbi:MAG TPA: hypothetical protein VGF38_21325 [Ktedonobacterales bacterium]|jgi:hypothetical protein
MVPETFANYFLATAEAGAALIGLLFVAIEIRPNRTLGRGASPPRRGVASGAFTALVNAFFISTAALVPTINVGYLILLLGLSGVANSVWQNIRLLRGPWRMRRPHEMTRVQWMLILLGAQVLPVALYTSESLIAVAIIVSPQAQLPIDALTYVLLGVYGVGLIRAWELLGGTASGLSWLNHTVDGVRGDHRVANNAGVLGDVTPAAPDAPKPRRSIGEKADSAPRPI